MRWLALLSIIFLCSACSTRKPPAMQEAPLAGSSAPQRMTGEAQLNAAITEDSAWLDHLDTEAELKADREYRKQLASILHEADRIEIFLLDFTMTPTNASAFPIWPYAKEAKILAQTTVPKQAHDLFLNQLAVALNPPVEGGAFCHYPIHGVRLYRGDEMFFESSLCWACLNMSVAYPTGPGFSRIHESHALYELFIAAMPIPPEEHARFEVYLTNEDEQK